MPGRYFRQAPWSSEQGKFNEDLSAVLGPLLANFFAAFSRAVASALSVASWGIFFGGFLALPLHGFSVLFAERRGVLVTLFVSWTLAPRGEYFMGASRLIEFFLRQGCSMHVIRN